MVDREVRPYYKPPAPGCFGSRSAQVAQLVEHATENRSVGGSIPPLGTISAQNCEPLRRRTYARQIAVPAAGTAKMAAGEPSRPSAPGFQA